MKSHEKEAGFQSGRRDMVLSFYIIILNLILFQENEYSHYLNDLKNNIKRTIFNRSKHYRKFAPRQLSVIYSSGYCIS